MPGERNRFVGIFNHSIQDKGVRIMPDYTKVIETLMEGNKENLQNLVKKALDDKVAAKDILDEGLIKGMDIVGEKMQEGEMFIPEVLRSAAAMNSALEILKPLLSAGDIRASGKVVIGTVKGDLHDIGKNLVKMMLETAGFEVVDLGVDVEPKGFVDAIKGNNSNVLALSALLTTTMPVMKQTVDAITEAGLRDGVKILIGGAPVTKQYADQIGADGYAADAGAASKLLKGMLG
jgi:5-methyltetrahydrofolate--homocysteine methyltransferase